LSGNFHHSCRNLGTHQSVLGHCRRQRRGCCGHVFFAWRSMPASFER